MKRIVSALDKLNWGRPCAVFALCATVAIALPAQTLTTIFSFDGTDGADASAALVQATDGNFYGTTWDGGANGFGTVFRITPSGALTILYSFCSLGVYPICPDGSYPNGGLVQASDGDFYGTTEAGGANGGGTIGNGAGTVFKITASGTLTTLYSFCAQSGCVDGASSYAGLVQAANGNFYGTTYYGGAIAGPYGYGAGTVFQITASGTLTTLYSFCSRSGCVDGYSPYAALVQATNGDFYGTTPAGGAHGSGGTIFKITPSGMLTTLYSFCSQSGCTDGAASLAGLVEATNGDFYGTTKYGGASDDGTVFKVTPAGTLTTLHSFCSQSGCTDGANPAAGLVEATDGDFYGTTVFGGTSACPPQHGCGTVFKITPAGMLTTVYSFCPQGGYPSGCTDGEFPIAGLLQATSGDFYGTTQHGGLCGQCGGTLFSLSVGLSPFVKTQPHSGKVGAAITILGTDLTGATSVSFNGTPAAFKVVSATEITTIVPAGATTGKIQVTTPRGALFSSGPFLVMP